MIDKAWYDWQNKHPLSRYAFQGGSVSMFTNATLYAEFPNGAPPNLNVSSLNMRVL